LSGNSIAFKIMGNYQVNTTTSPIQKLRMVLMAVIMVAMLGTFGLMSLENMSFMDALYMTVITLSTVGFGEVKELHADSRIFVPIAVFL